MEQRPLTGDIRYSIEPGIEPSELLAFYQAQRHRAPRSSDKLVEMIGNSACFVTARDAGGGLIGIARGLTDGVRGYLTECKLDPRYQGPGAVTRTDGRIEHDDRGIARELGTRVLQRLRERGCERIDVIAYGTEEDFLEELGFRRTSGVVAMALENQPVQTGEGC